MGYQWGKSPLGAAGWKARALAEEERATEFAAEIERLQAAVGDARTERNAARHELERANRSAWDAIERLVRKVEDLRDRSDRNAARVRMLAGDLRDARGRVFTLRRTLERERAEARVNVQQVERSLAARVRMLAGDLRDAQDALDEAGRIQQQWVRRVLELRRRLDARAARVRMLAGDLRDAREGLDDARGRIRQQGRTVLELRRRLDARADRVEALAGDLRNAGHFFRHLERTLEQEREANRINVEQLERSLAAAQSRAVEAEEKSAASAPPAPDVVAWETRVRDLEGALRDQQSITEAWKREAGDARRAVTILRGALTTARFNAAHTGSEAARVLELTEEIDSRDTRKG